MIVRLVLQYQKLIAKSIVVMLFFVMIGQPVLAQQETQKDDDKQFSKEVCSITPTMMADYMQMAKQIISVLNYVPTSTEQETPFGAWQGGAYQVADRNKESRKIKLPRILENIIQGITKDIGRKVDGITTTAIIVASQVKNTAFDGMRGMLGIFSQPRPIVRDLKKLYEIDILLGEKIDELGLAGYYFEPLQETPYEQITAIMQSHIGGNSLLDGFTLEEGATYANLVSMLLMLNEKHKAFLAVGGVERFGDAEDLKSITRKKVMITINGTYGERLKQEYLGARRYICDTTFKQFKDSINNIGKTFKGGVGNEVKIWKEAVNRLANVSLKTDLSKATEKEKEYLQRERELLKTLYGIDVDKRLTDDLDDVNNASIDENGIEIEGGFGLAPLRRTLAAKQSKSPEKILADKKARDALREQRKNEREDKKELRDFQREEEKRQRIAKIEEQKRLQGNDPVGLYFAPAQGDVSEDMAEISDAVLQLHEETIALMYQTQATDLTDKVYNILQEVRVAHNTIKSKDGENDIIHNLGYACEAQCSNAGGTCRDM